MELASGVHRYGGGPVNWYLVEEGGKVTAVDAGTPGDWAVFMAALRDLGRSPADVEAVVLTHAHQDHIGFAERARSEAGVPVRVHEADAALARGERPPRRDRSLLPYLRHRAALSLLVYFLRKGAARTPPVQEAHTFADGETLDVPGRPRVIHAPGHTEGSCALHLPERGTLLSGDVLVTRNPLTGRPGPQVMPAAFNADTAQALEALGRLEGLDAAAVLPGHGDPWTGGVAEAVRLARAAGPS
ncbi:MAG TPA: MBL fold metallo-hydrolase [Dehalococcoidia bacterium]